MSSANSVLFLTVLLSLSCLSAVLGQGSCDASIGKEGPSCDFRCDAGSYLVDCGTESTDKTSCEAVKCCWNPYVPPGSPKCFKRNGGYAFCSNSRERESCIHEDEKIKISKAECERRNCCFDDSKGAGRDACFFHNTNYNPLCPYNERVECGKNLKKEDCIKKGCCWSPCSYCQMEPSCFFPIVEINRRRLVTNSADPLPPIPAPSSPPKVGARNWVKTEL